MDHILIANDDGQIPTLRCRPHEPGPLLAIIPSIFGVTPDVVHFAKTFAENGALVYAIDPFWRCAPGPLRIPADFEDAMQRMHQTDVTAVTTDVLAALDEGLTDARCNGKTIALGICFGGKIAANAAKHRSVQGLAAWHGAGLLPALDIATLDNTHISFDFGANDPLIPIAEVDAIRTALPKHNGSIRIHPGAGHGFTHRDTLKCHKAAMTAAMRGVSEIISALR